MHKILRNVGWAALLVLASYERNWPLFCVIVIVMVNVAILWDRLDYLEMHTSRMFEQFTKIAESEIKHMKIVLEMLTEIQKGKMEGCLACKGSGRVYVNPLSPCEICKQCKGRGWFKI